MDIDLPLPIGPTNNHIRGKIGGPIEATFRGMSEADRKTQRKPIAERLYKQGFTMEAIATQLGVSRVFDCYLG